MDRGGIGKGLVYNALSWSTIKSEAGGKLANAAPASARCSLFRNEWLFQ